MKLSQINEIKNLKEKDIIKIKGKEYEIVSLGWEGEYDSKKKEIKNFRNYTLHEFGAKNILPSFSITFREDLKKIVVGKEEIALEDIEIYKREKMMTTKPPNGKYFGVTFGDQTFYIKS